MAEGDGKDSLNNETFDVDAFILKTKTKQDALREALTNTIQKIETALLDLETLSIDDLELNIDSLLSRWENLRAVDSEIETNLDPDGDELRKEIVSALEFSDKVHACEFRARKKLRQLQRDDDAGSNLSRNSNETDDQNRSGKNLTRLPKLTIKKFLGDYTLWQSFWNSFQVAIHDNTSLSKVEKFTYLKSYLGGSAANAIEGFSISEQNYDQVIKLLESRFGRKEIIINSHMEKLINLTPVTKSTETAELRHLCDTIEIQVRSLSSLEVKPETYSHMLIPVLLKKLPHEITLDFTRKTEQSDFFDVEKLLEFVRTEIECRERNSLLAPSSPPHFEPYRHPNSRKEKKSPSAAELFTSVDGENACLFCRGAHKSESCDELSVDRKKDLLREQGRCFLCLKERHRMKDCRSRRGNCSKCSGRHNRAICFKAFDKQPKKEVGSEESKNLSALSVGVHKGVLLQTCSGVLKKKNESTPVRILLDNGSMRTFVTQDIVDRLGIPSIRKETLSVFTFGSKPPIRKVFDVVKIGLENREYRKKGLTVEALVTNRISGSDLPPPDSFRMKKVYKDLEGLQLADMDSNEGVSVLIGADYYYQVVTGKLRRLEKHLTAAETLFGWCLQGYDENHSDALSTLNVVVGENLISEQVRKFWELESLGIKCEDEPQNLSNDAVLRKFEAEITFDNSRYKVKLPWKPEKKHLLHDNAEIAKQRFCKLLRRFKANPDLFNSYNAVIQDYLQQNIIEPVTDHSSLENEATFYLPHREVIRNDRETTKLRVVFDASSHGPGEISLNDCLNVGPNLYPDIFGLLLNFRVHPIAFTGDIKQAFLQIEIDEKDRDASRFLFVENPFEETQDPLVFRFTRVLFGMNCSPFLLAATIKYHLKRLENDFPETCQFLENHIYVDDVIGSQENVEKAFQVTSECTDIFKKAGMVLHKWRTNSSELRELWPERGDNVGSSLKVLGVVWDETSDRIAVDVDNLMIFLTRRVDTKRFVLQALGRIFDPLGLFAPFVVRAKMLIQQMWTLNLDWDEDLPRNLRLLWNKWCSEVPCLKELSVPRYYLSTLDGAKKIELHCFSDASKLAYGTVAYLRIESSGGLVSVVFVASKSRVAPLKDLTLPRLELMGALLSARLGDTILKTLNLNLNPVFWTDAKIVLFWIKDYPKKFKPFVKNRIVEIQKLTAPNKWLHCPGKENPADLVSRGEKVQKLVDNPLWIQGPGWLRLPHENWPHQDENFKIFKDPEYLKPVIQFQCAVSQDILEVSKFSSLGRLIRVTAWVKRFLFNLKNSEKRKEALSVEELKEAENFLIKAEQEKFYFNEVQALGRNEAVHKKSSLYVLNPFLDEDGLMRIGSRLENSADFSYSEKNPVLIPRESWLTTLIVDAEHKKIFHGGVSATLVRVRSRYWIPKGRQTIKRVLSRCLICRKYSAKPAQQKTSPLPRDRVSEAPPFYVTGTDFAGPLHVKTLEASTKTYICLFTCAVTRAIHLELVSSLSTDHFLMALRRFVARRGICHVIYSDNAKTFKKADCELTRIFKILRSKGVQEQIANMGIQWKFIPERAAWWGGFYERLVQSVKMCLKKVLGRALLSAEELSTLLAEIEAALNSRPLTHVPADGEDFDILTPEHFLAGRSSVLTPPLNVEQVLRSSSRDGLTKRKRYRELLLKQVWSKWKEQYLLLLRTAHQLQTPGSSPSLEIGDVVLIAEDKKPRAMWTLGRIAETMTGRDGLVRSCIVRTPKGLMLRRPVQLLYPLEIPKQA